MPEPKVFETVADGGTLVVTPSGSGGSLAGESLSVEIEEIMKRLDDGELKHVVFDFKEVPYFGSTMLGAMQATWKHVAPGGGRLAICNISNVGREVLQVSRFDTIWFICDSRDEALAAVAAL
jgi:anti-anti-sigma factor